MVLVLHFSHLNKGFSKLKLLSNSSISTSKSLIQELKSKINIEEVGIASFGLIKANFFAVRIRDS